MRCPICSEEVRDVDQAERWGPEFAHATCVTAYNAGKAAERERWQRVAAAAQAVTNGAEDIGDFLVSSSLMAALALALDEGPNDGLEHAGADALLRHLLSKHFYVSSDGSLSWKYTECTDLLDVDSVEFEKALLPYLKPEDAKELAREHMKRGL